MLVLANFKIFRLYSNSYTPPVINNPFDHFCRIQTIPTKLNINVTKDNLNCESKLINSLEHIQLRVDLNYTNRAVLAIDVQSMSGTSSRMVYPRTLDTIGNPPTYNNLVVTSVHFWEEPLLGIWTVNIVEETPIPRINGTGKCFAALIISEQLYACFFNSRHIDTLSLIDFFFLSNLASKSKTTSTGPFSSMKKPI